MAESRRDRMMRVRPWEKSTGPRTAEGKAKSAQRWRKHGYRSTEYAALRAYLKSVRKLTAALSCLK